MQKEREVNEEGRWGLLIFITSFLEIFFGLWNLKEHKRYNILKTGLYKMSKMKKLYSLGVLEIKQYDTLEVYFLWIALLSEQEDTV